MKRFISGENRSRITLLPEYLDDYVSEDSPVRIVDVFVKFLSSSRQLFSTAMGKTAFHTTSTHSCPLTFPEAGTFISIGLFQVQLTSVNRQRSGSSSCRCALPSTLRHQRFL